MWTAVPPNSLRIDDHARGIRTDDSTLVREGRVTEIRPAAVHNRTVVRINGYNTHSDRRVYHLRSSDHSEIVSGAHFTARPLANLGDPDHDIVGRVEVVLGDVITYIGVDSTPNLMIISDHLWFVRDTGLSGYSQVDPTHLLVGDHVMCSTYSPDPFARNLTGGLTGIVAAIRPGAGGGIDVREDGEMHGGLSHTHRTWYRRTTTPTESEGESPVTESTWVTVAPRDIRIGDTIRLSHADNHALFPPANQGQVTRNMPHEFQVDIRLPEDVESWSAGDVRRGLSTNPRRRVVQRLTTTATSTAPTPTGWVPVTSVSDLAIGDKVRARTYPDGPWSSDQWVTSLTYSGYDVVTAPVPDRDRQVNGYQFRHGIEKWIDAPAVPEWRPATQWSDLLVGTYIRGTLDNGALFEGSITRLSHNTDPGMGGRDYWGHVQDTTMRPGTWSFRNPALDHIEIRDLGVPDYEWVRVTRPETLVPGDVVRPLANISRHGRFTELVTTTAGTNVRYTRTSGASDTISLVGGLQVRRVRNSAEGYRWELVINRRDLTPGDMVRDQRSPRYVGTFVRNDADGDLAYDDADNGRRAYMGPTRTVEKRVSASAPRDPSAPLRSAEHQTLAGLRYAIYKFAQDESSSCGTGDNCDSGTNEFLAAVGLPRLSRDPLVDESAEIDAQLRRVQEYLSRDSIGISREKADSYLEAWGIPKRPQQRRVQVTMMLDGTTTDAEIMERIPRVIRDATNLRVLAA